MKSLIRQRDEIEAKITKYRDKCPHENKNVVHKANTGNYDPSSDIFWDESNCLDCGKCWSKTTYIGNPAFGGHYV